LVVERLAKVDNLTVGYQWLSALDFKTLEVGEMAIALRRRLVFDLVRAAGFEQPNGALNIGRIALKAVTTEKLGAVSERGSKRCRTSADSPSIRLIPTRCSPPHRRTSERCISTEVHRFSNVKASSTGNLAGFPHPGLARSDAGSPVAALAE
jgi:hypothetical protein